MKKAVIFLFLLSFIFASGCKKNKNAGPANRLSKMAGTRDWHGVLQYDCWLCQPQQSTEDSTFETIKITVLNDSMFVADNDPSVPYYIEYISSQNKYYHFKSKFYDDYFYLHEYYYYYEADSITFYSKSATSGSSYRKQLHTTN